MTDSPAIGSAELLGFPADARLLIVNADDLGMSEAIDVAMPEHRRRGGGPEGACDRSRVPDLARGSRDRR
jgi:hypothetical protein